MLRPFLHQVPAAAGIPAKDEARPFTAGAPAPPGRRGGLIWQGGTRSRLQMDRLAAPMMAARVATPKQDLS